jgi:hypothetical protein
MWGELIHVWAWKLGWVLGRSSEPFVGQGRKRREVFTGGGNGGRWRKGSPRRGGPGGAFIGGAVCRGGFSRPSSSAGVARWSQGSRVVGRRCRPMAASVCGRRLVQSCRVAPAYGQERVTPLRHTVPTTPCFRSAVAVVSQRVRACI